MPKKTKREKLLAEYHRHAAPAPVVVSLPKRQHVDVTNTTFTLTTPVSQAKAMVMADAEFLAIKRDLTKSVLLIGGIIVGELLLSRYLS